MTTLSKKCPTCKVDKPFSEWGKNKNRKNGLAGQCKACITTRAKQRYSENPEKYKSIARARYAADPQKARLAAKKSREKNPAAVKASQKKYKTANKDAIRKQERIWTEQNRERVRGKNRKRRALLRSVQTEPYATKDIINKWGNNCHLCKQPIDLSLPRKGDPMGLNLDHVIPISKGGHDIIANVKPAHAYCNQSKKDKVTALE